MLPHPSVSNELSESPFDVSVVLQLQLCAAINAGDALASFAAARLVYQRMQALQMCEMTSMRPIYLESLSVDVNRHHGAWRPLMVNIF